MRQAVLSAFDANWKSATSAAAPRTTMAPPLPAMTGQFPPPVAPDALNYAPVPAYVLPPVLQRTIDRGQLAGGPWLELDGPILRIGTTNAMEVQPIIDALRAKGQVVRRLQSMRASLEDLFLEAVTDPTSGQVSSPGARQGNGSVSGGQSSGGQS
jgi:hypothetical protein